ncbi:hypothetical protein CYY_005890 [Polysphondylium violaceum]|uniref:Uncharacterized protein n=1 Tax=Polysphondylium violaceum TaxID=133409 RepID=A0A8J4PV80_9MYCE|nr:hypothetical protein CYY_005890 [Polysphondylium violaceum]
MNYDFLLEKLGVTIDPLERNGSEYKTILNYIENGQKDQDDEIECIDIFKATRPIDVHKDFDDNTLLLWYGCFTSSVASKLMNGISPSFNKFTDYKSISLWDNVIGCSNNIDLFKSKDNKGILMLVQVNYQDIIVPSLVEVDKNNKLNQEYFASISNYNEDDDTEDENETNTNNIDRNVYCTKVQDKVEIDQILKINGKYSPDPNGLVVVENYSIPLGTPILSTKTNNQGWLNGYLKTFGTYNQFLIPHHGMIKLKYLVVIKPKEKRKYKSKNNSNNSNKLKEDIIDLDKEEKEKKEKITG